MPGAQSLLPATRHLQGWSSTSCREKQLSSFVVPERQTQAKQCEKCQQEALAVPSPRCCFTT